MGAFKDFLLKVRPEALSSVIASRGDSVAEANSGDVTMVLNKQNIYPSDLFTPGVEPYILFFVRDGVARTGTIKNKMALYMPRSLSVNYGATYQEIEMTVYQYADLVTDYKSATSPGNESGMDKWAAALALATRAGANAIDFKAGANFGQQVEVIERDMTVNPHMALLFSGVEFRTFTFRFQMMARNEQESKSIQRIIQTFKQAMHPAKSSARGARYWTFPDNFDIGLFTPAHGYLFNMSTCVLTNMHIDYAGSEIPSFFTPTGAPVDIRMDLTFKELEIMTRERIQEGY